MIQWFIIINFRSFQARFQSVIIIVPSQTLESTVHVPLVTDHSDTRALVVTNTYHNTIIETNSPAGAPWFWQRTGLSMVGFHRFHPNSPLTAHHQPSRDPRSRPIPLHARSVAVSGESQLYVRIVAGRPIGSLRVSKSEVCIDSTIISVTSPRPSI